MKVLLINPKEEEPFVEPRNKKILFAPLSLQILASLIPKGMEIDIIDENFQNIDFDSDYDLAAVTSHHFFPNKATKRICAEFRTRDIPVVLGGIYPSLKMQNASKLANSVTIGEAEALWPKILSDAKKNHLKKVYKHRLIDLNSYTKHLPRRDLTDNRKYYAQIVEISRGCPYKCDFCVTAYLNKGGYRLFPTKRIIKDVANAKDNPTLIKNHIFLADDNLSIKPQYKIKLLKDLIPYDIIWSSQSDINITKNEKLLNVAAKSGCYELLIGFESINQHALRSVRKHHHLVKDYKKAVKAIHNYGIRVVGSFMFGMDLDTLGVGKRTLEFINEAGIDNVVTHHFEPPEGTDFFEVLKKEGRIIPYSSEDGTTFSFKMKNFTKENLAKEIEYVKHGRRLFRPIVFNRNISVANTTRLLFYKLQGIRAELSR